MAENCGGICSITPRNATSVFSMSRALAVTSARRSAFMPELPTVDEAGLAGFHFSVWTALWAPKGTPAGTIRRLNTAATGALAQPAIAKRLADQGQRATGRQLETDAVDGVEVTRPAVQPRRRDSKRAFGRRSTRSARPGRR